MEKPKNSRREFLKKVCPSVAFAFFGISFFEACSTDENPNETNQNNCQEISNSNLGYIIEDCVFKIDLSHSNFSSLVEIGGWMNGYNIGLDMLFLRSSKTSSIPSVNTTSPTPLNRVYSVITAPVTPTPLPNSQTPFRKTMSSNESNI